MWMYGQTFTSTHHRGSLIEHCKRMVTMEPARHHVALWLRNTDQDKGCTPGCNSFCRWRIFPMHILPWTPFCRGITSTMYIWMHFFSGKKWEIFIPRWGSCGHHVFLHFFDNESSHNCLPQKKIIQVVIE